MSHDCCEVKGRRVIRLETGRQQQGKLFVLAGSPVLSVGARGLHRLFVEYVETIILALDFRPSR